jgi:DNA-directed RNA polymerase subunit RPC12/RpoP
MPLIECPDCGQRVSDAAPSCVGCGRPIAGSVATVRSGSMPAAYTPSSDPTYRCSKCGSDQVRKLSVVHAGGLSQVATQTSGLGLTLGGSLGVGSAKTSGVHQTALSQAAAPPQKQNVGVLSVLCVVLGVAFAANPEMRVMGILIVLVASWYVWSRIKYNREVFPGLYHRWERTYMCERCGQQSQIG